MLSWEYPPNVTGGMGSHLAGLTPALMRAGVEVEVITPQPAHLSGLGAAGEFNGSSGEAAGAGVTVHRVPLVEDVGDIYIHAQKTNQAIQARGREVLSTGQQFDLIHAHDWLVVFAAQALKHEYRLPLIATVHATEKGRVRGEALQTDLQRNIHGAEWWLVYEAWRVITCSYHMASEAQAFFHTPHEKIDIVPNGINISPNTRLTPEELAGCRSRYACLDHQIVFAVGRMVYEKGFHLLIQAMPQVLAEFPDTHFVIAGRGPETLHLAQQATRLGVQDHVTFPGFISDAERDCLYQAAACAVFPSLYEPFGIVALEAMAAGCPVVVSEVGGLREVVQHGKTGLTVYPDNPQSIAWGILRVLRQPQRAVARAEEAREAVRRDFSWDTVAAQTIEVYRRVIEERKRIVW
jgi:glycosyltransferase involved in cell wall biosynthesis